jgi:type I restriction enzyme S subunit
MMQFPCEYIEQCDERAGSNYTVDDVIGISTDKKFIDTKANMSGVSINSYKVVKPLEFAYVADTSRRGDKIALALNDSDKPVLVSSIYTAFRCKDTNQLLPKYLFMLLNRNEFDRYARFNSWGSARETFDWNEMCRVEIPLPDPKVQEAIVNLFNCADRAKKIASQARERLKTLCPALVQRAANS